MAIWVVKVSRVGMFEADDTEPQNFVVNAKEHDQAIRVVAADPRLSLRPSASIKFEATPMTPVDGADRVLRLI